MIFSSFSCIVNLCDDETSKFVDLTSRKADNSDDSNGCHPLVAPNSLLDDDSGGYETVLEESYVSASTLDDSHERVVSDDSGFIAEIELPTLQTELNIDNDEKVVKPVSLTNDYQQNSGEGYDPEQAVHHSSPQNGTSAKPQSEEKTKVPTSVPEVIESNVMLDAHIREYHGRGVFSTKEVDQLGGCETVLEEKWWTTAGFSVDANDGEETSQEKSDIEEIESADQGDIHLHYLGFFQVDLDGNPVKEHSALRGKNTSSTSLMMTCVMNDKDDRKTSLEDNRQDCAEQRDADEVLSPFCPEGETTLEQSSSSEAQKTFLKGSQTLENLSMSLSHVNANLKKVVGLSTNQKETSFKSYEVNPKVAQNLDDVTNRTECSHRISDDSSTVFEDEIGLPDTRNHTNLPKLSATLPDSARDEHARCLLGVVKKLAHWPDVDDLGLSGTRNDSNLPKQSATLADGVRDEYPRYLLGSVKKLNDSAKVDDLGLKPTSVMQPSAVVCSRTVLYETRQHLSTLRKVPEIGRCSSGKNECWDVNNSSLPSLVVGSTCDEHERSHLVDFYHGISTAREDEGCCPSDEGSYPSSSELPFSMKRKSTITPSSFVSPLNVPSRVWEHRSGFDESRKMCANGRGSCGATGDSHLKFSPSQVGGSACYEDKRSSLVGVRDGIYQAKADDDDSGSPITERVVDRQQKSKTNELEVLNVTNLSSRPRQYLPSFRFRKVFDDGRLSSARDDLHHQKFSHAQLNRNACDENVQSSLACAHEDIYNSKVCESTNPSSSEPPSSMQQPSTVVGLANPPPQATKFQSILEEFRMEFDNGKESSGRRHDSSLHKGTLTPLNGGTCDWEERSSLGILEEIMYRTKADDQVSYPSSVERPSNMKQRSTSKQSEVVNTSYVSSQINNEEMTIGSCSSSDMENQIGSTDGRHITYQEEGSNEEGMKPVTSTKSEATIQNEKDPPICSNIYIPNLHKSKDVCERCLALASEEEKEKFKITGRNVRIMMVRGGCDNCALFPRAKGEIGVRMCKKCFFETHKRSS